ncbi:MAG: prepilin peptidase [bacterium]|nr:prepilin peptidase [bacterium]
MHYSIILILGLVVGSFINVLIYRIPRDIGFISGRSSCPKCNKKIPWYGLIPLFSFIWLNRKCLYCKNPISWIYPLIELSSGIVFMLVAILLFNPFSGYGLVPWLFYSMFIALMLALFVIDFRHMILPDSILLAILSFFTLYILAINFLGITDGIQLGIGITGRLLGIGIISGPLFLLWFFSRGQAIGFGDIKLLALLGLIFGLKGVLTVFYLSLVSGAIAGIIIIALGKGGAKTKIPFGTFITASASIYLFVWQKALFYLNDIFLKAFT